MSRTRLQGTRRALLIGLALVALPALAAVTEHYFFEFAGKGREELLEGRFDLALGRVQIGRAEEGFLFQAEVTLEDDDVAPAMQAETDGRTAHVALGFDSGKGGQGRTVRRLRPPEENQWLLFFSDRIPLDLAFDLGMVNGDLDFTGFRVRRLQIESGMAETRLAFGAPNPIEMEALAVDAGMARFHGERLGNARFRRFSFNGGAGSFTLDLGGGPLPPGAEAEIKVGMSSLRVQLPERTPVVLHTPDSWLTRVEIPDGYVKRGKGTWHSEQVRDEAAALHVRIEAGVGRVTVVSGGE